MGATRVDLACRGPATGSRRRASLALGLLAWSVLEIGAAPPQPPPGHQKIRLTVRSPIDLEPITINELLGGASTTVVFDGTDPGLSFLGVLREVPDIWEVKEPPPIPASAYQVNYFLSGANGVDDVLSLPGFPASMISVTIEEIPAMDVGGPPGPRRLQGGARFTLDPNQADMAGQYTGTLTVEVNRL